MTKKLLFAIAAAATMLVGCAKVIEPAQEMTGQQALDPEAVNFGVYVNRIGTKAGYQGTLNSTSDLQAAAVDGFGVFAYYTNGELYSETAKPDFMYNQRVTYGTSGWTYSPVKYWPNEFGTNAASEEVDRLTFFAYAPYAAVTPSTGVVTGDATYGIIGMTRNSASGNPLIKYYANLTPAEGVDLLWGVAAEDFESSVDGSNNNVDKGEPYIDVMKPKAGDKIKFDFKHALAQLNVQIDTDVDVESHADGDLAGETKIFVRSVTFEGFTTKGALDLNSDYTTSTTPSWYDVAGNGKLSLEPVTIYDGRRDGKEGVASAAAKNETPDDLNPVIVQSVPYDDAALSAGVTHSAVNLFNSNTLTDPVMVIPTGEPMKITIVYDVETQDDNLAGYLSDGAARGSSIENEITQEIVLADASDMELESGKKYTVKLHLGLTSVKFDAAVTAWTDGDETNADLPINTESIAAVNLTSTDEVMLWKDQTNSNPVISVLSSNGLDITSASTITWTSSDESIATVAVDGTVTAVTGGAATITATAEYNGNTASSSYEVKVNKVTGIYLLYNPLGTYTTTIYSSATSGYTSIESRPIYMYSLLTVLYPSDTYTYPDDLVTWTSNDPTGFAMYSQSVGKNLGSPAPSCYIKGLAESTSTFTMTVNPAYTEGAVISRNTSNIRCVKPFRERELSQGLLEKNGTDSWTVTDGSDPFEILNYYMNDEEYNDDFSSAHKRHYFQWNELSTYFGVDASNTIDYSSHALTDGWEIPVAFEGSYAMHLMLSGVASTRLNGSSYGYSRFIRISVDLSGSSYAGKGASSPGAVINAGNPATGNYINGMLLIPDYSDITCAELSDFTTEQFSANTLTYNQVCTLVEGGCRFYPCTGRYSTSGWDKGNTDGYLWCAEGTSAFPRRTYINRTMMDASSTLDGSLYIPVMLYR